MQIAWRKRLQRRAIELTFWVGAFACFAVGGLTAMHARQARQKSLKQYPNLAAPTALLVRASEHERSGVYIEGRIEVKRLGLNVPILSQCNDHALSLGSCHIAGTADAGGLGNMGIAGHRDTSFRPLRNIKQGDLIDVISSKGDYTYQVTHMGVVPADDTSVLTIGDEPELTLVTCFPFNFIGSAPNRFVVHARLQSVYGSGS